MQSLRQFAGSLLFAALLVLACVHARAEDWTAPAADLARRIAAKGRPGSGIALTVRNSSSLSAAEVAAIAAQIESQLRNQRLPVVEAAKAAATVRVTLSENVEGYLWVAEVDQGTADDVVMVAVARRRSAEMRSGALRLTAKLLIAQDEPILDVTMRGDGAVVLTPSKVTWYRIQSGHWQELRSSPVIHARPFPRDVRGRIWTVSQNALDVSLPGLRCTQLNVDVVLSCTETDDPWPLPSTTQAGMKAFYSPLRNFFNGTVTFQTESGSGQQISQTVPPFYSAAVTMEGGLPVWMFAGVDDQVTFAGGSGRALSSRVVPEWGSGLATAANPCAQESSVVLATRRGDYSQADAVQAFQVVDRNPSALTPPFELPGPVTALWSGEEGSQNVTTVVWNLKTSRYEAYSLSLACNQ